MTRQYDYDINRRTVLKTAATAFALGVASFSLTGSAVAEEHDPCDPVCETEVPLCAGQHIDVGTVHVRRSGDETIDVEYVLDGETENDWQLVESHLYVGKNSPPTSAPGQFPFQDSYPDGTTGDTYTIGFDEVCEYELGGGGNGKGGGGKLSEVDGSCGISQGDCVYVAAHAVVEEIVTEAPYFAASVVDYAQGTKKNLDPVASERSNSVAALEQEYPDSPRDDLGFFSLGFEYDAENEEFADEGGYIDVEFDCPIRNGDGDDLRIWEVTFGDYPLETADVYAWDGQNWLLLGGADNTDQGPEGSPEALTVSDFDLDAVGLDSTARVRIVDTTDPGPHDGNADGFDLDGIQSLQDCTREETAWADGCDGTEITDGGNWATYFQYGVGTCEPTLPECPMYGTSRVGSSEGEVEIWSIRYDSDSDTIVEETVGDIPDNSTNEDYPNGLAFDPATEVWYFTEEQGILKTMNEDGCLGITVYGGITDDTSIAGATVYDGGYYFTPQGGDTLWKVDLENDGSVATNDDGAAVVDSNVRTLPLSDNGFGDIASTDDGVLYFSVNGAFFTVDLDDASNDGVIVQSTDRENYAVLSQLAFDDTDTLWAHHAGTGAWRTVDFSTGALSDTIGTTRTYTDLATCGTFTPCE